MIKVRERKQKVLELVLADCEAHFLKWKVSIFGKQTKKKLYLGNTRSIIFGLGLGCVWTAPDF